MTRWPVFSTSAGGPSNAIFRGLRPSFATPMKGAIRMHEPHDTPRWTSQRTRALFRLFQTAAPPDFQRQILARVAKRQHAQQPRRLGGRALLAWGPGSRAWGRGTHPRHHRGPGPLIALIGCCSLVLGTSLAGWVLQRGPAAPPAPALLTRAISLPRTPDVPTEAPLRGDSLEGFGSAEPPEGTGHAAPLPTSGPSAPQMPLGPSVDKRTAFQAGDDPAHASLVPAPVSQLTVQKERQLPGHRSTQRAGRPRGAPGKSSRSHTRAGTSPQAPG